MDFSLEEKHFKILRQSYNDMNFVFNIETYEIIVSLFYDEELDIEKEKVFLDQFARKCKLCKRGWQTTSRITTFRLEFNYSDVLFDR